MIHATNEDGHNPDGIDFSDDGAKKKGKKGKHGHKDDKDRLTDAQKE